MYMACHSCPPVSQTNNSHFYLWNGKSDYRFTGTLNILTDFSMSSSISVLLRDQPIPEIPAKAPDNAEILRNERQLSSFFIVQDLIFLRVVLFIRIRNVWTSKFNLY